MLGDNTINYYNLKIKLFLIIKNNSLKNYYLKLCYLILIIISI